MDLSIMGITQIDGRLRHLNLGLMSAQVVDHSPVGQRFIILAVLSRSYQSRHLQDSPHTMPA